VPKATTHFERIPVEDVKKVVAGQHSAAHRLPPVTVQRHERRHTGIAARIHLALPASAHRADQT
jgi:hypothetical protein